MSRTAWGPSSANNSDSSEGRSYRKLRDQTCTQWAFGWLAFQKKATNIYPSLDFNFDLPSDEEAEESLSADYSGEPDTPAEAHSPSYDV